MSRNVMIRALMINIIIIVRKCRPFSYDYDYVFDYDYKSMFNLLSAEDDYDEINKVVAFLKSLA